MSIQLDPAAPLELVGIQTWFAGIITQRLTDDDEIQEITPQGKLIIDEAEKFVTRSQTLLPHERMQIYCQSYWTRLLDTLEDAYPLVASLFGRFEFRKLLAIPYFLATPANHWDLNLLGASFVTYLENTYHEKDRPFVLQSAKVDLALQECFFSKTSPHIDTSCLTEEELSNLLQKTLSLQPYIHCFELPYDLFSYREAFLKEDVDYWLEHDFPKLEKSATYFFVIFRNDALKVSWEKISQAEYLLLTAIKAGKSIEEACELLESAGEQIYQQALENIISWIQKWLSNSWLIEFNH